VGEGGANLSVACVMQRQRGAVCGDGGGGGGSCRSSGGGDRCILVSMVAEEIGIKSDGAETDRDLEF
jgi:hypothetical protein